MIILKLIMDKEIYTYIYIHIQYIIINTQYIKYIIYTVHTSSIIVNPKFPNNPTGPHRMIVVGPESPSKVHASSRPVLFSSEDIGCQRFTQANRFTAGEASQELHEGAQLWMCKLLCHVLAMPLQHLIAAWHTWRCFAQVWQVNNTTNISRNIFHMTRWPCWDWRQRSFADSNYAGIVYSDLPTTNSVRKCLLQPAAPLKHPCELHGSFGFQVLSPKNSESTLFYILCFEERILYKCVCV